MKKLLVASLEALYTNVSDMLELVTIAVLYSYYCKILCT